MQSLSSVGIGHSHGLYVNGNSLPIHMLPVLTECSPVLLHCGLILICTILSQPLTSHQSQTRFSLNSTLSISQPSIAGLSIVYIEYINRPCEVRKGVIAGWGIVLIGFTGRRLRPLLVGIELRRGLNINGYILFLSM